MVGAILGALITLSFVSDCQLFIITSLPERVTPDIPAVSSAQYSFVSLDFTRAQYEG